MNSKNLNISKENITHARNRYYKFCTLDYIDWISIQSNIFQCKDIADAIAKHEVVTYGMLDNGIESKKLINYIESKDEINILPATLNEFRPTNTENSCYCNVVLFCMFWNNTKYEKLISRKCDDKDIYDLAEKDFAYTFDIYTKAHISLTTLVNATRVMFDANEETSIINKNIELLRKGFEPISEEEYGGQEDASFFLRRLITLLDYKKDYKVRGYNSFVWNFGEEERRAIGKYIKERLEGVEVEVKEIEKYIEGDRNLDFILDATYLNLKEYYNFIEGGVQYGTYITECKPLFTKVFGVEVPSPSDIGYKNGSQLIVSQTVQTRYKHLPPVITISIDRITENGIEEFYIDYKTLDSTFRLLRVPCDGQTKDAYYQVCGIVWHKGGESGGHYTACRRIRSDLWQYFDDTKTLSGTTDTVNMLLHFNGQRHYPRILFAEEVVSLVSGF